MFGFLSFLSLLSLVIASSLESRATNAFAASSAIDARGLLTAARAANKKSVASYQPDPGSKQWVNIYADWLESAGVFHFIADMDVDCDGPSYQCAGNTDGQAETSFGRLDATKVPWVVLPLSFTQKFSKNIKPNSLTAVVCNGKMFYGIFGDQNGASPEVIGEASLLLAQSCFPNDGINGNNGHDPLDVLYIVFGSAVPSGVGEETINVSALKALGDKQVLSLQSAILNGGSSNTNSGKSGNSNPPPKPQSGAKTDSTPSKSGNTTGGSKTQSGTKADSTPSKSGNTTTTASTTTTTTTSKRPAASNPSNSTRKCRPRQQNNKRHRRRLTSLH